MTKKYSVDKYVYDTRMGLEECVKAWEIPENIFLRMNNQLSLRYND